MKILIVCLGITCLLNSCKSKLVDDCRKIKMYQPINLIFKDSIKFKNESIDEIEFQILNENQNWHSTEPIDKEIYEEKKIYQFKLGDSISANTRIELKMSDKKFKFSNFDFGKVEIETMFGSSYETCLLRGCEINGKYEKTPFHIRID